MINYFSENPGMIIIVLCFAWILIGLGIEGHISQKYNINNSLFILFPHELYDNTKLNMVGSWLIWILLTIINPFGCIVKIILFIILAVWALIIDPLYDKCKKILTKLFIKKE